MHPIVKAYFKWVYCFKRSLSDEAAHHPEWRKQQQDAWNFFRALRDNDP